MAREGNPFVSKEENNTGDTGMWSEIGSKEEKLCKGEKGTRDSVDDATRQHLDVSDGAIQHEKPVRGTGTGETHRSRTWRDASVVTRW